MSEWNCEECGQDVREPSKGCKSCNPGCFPEPLTYEEEQHLRYVLVHENDPRKVAQINREDFTDPKATIEEAMRLQKEEGYHSIVIFENGTRHATISNGGPERVYWEEEGPRLLATLDQAQSKIVELLDGHLNILHRRIDELRADSLRGDNETIAAQNEEITLMRHQIKKLEGKTMTEKKFVYVVSAKSEGCDDYGPWVFAKKPSMKQLEKFLREKCEEDFTEENDGPGEWGSYLYITGPNEAEVL
jgi:hypothetical protein